MNWWGYLSHFRHPIQTYNNNHFKKHLSGFSFAVDPVHKFHNDVMQNLKYWSVDAHSRDMPSLSNTQITIAPSVDKGEL